MLIVLRAVAAIFVLIVLGGLLRRLGYRKAEFWATLDSMTYYVLIPAMLFSKIAAADPAGAGPLARGLWVVLAAFCVILALCVGLGRALAWEPARFSSAFQGALRYNTYIFLGVVTALHGEAGLVVAAFIMAVMIPLINVACVAMFALCVRQGAFSWTGALKNIATNPLILACLLGSGANALNLPSALVEPLRLLGSAAVVCGLLSVGAGLRFRDLAHLRSEFFTSAALKLVVYPALTLAGARLVGLPPVVAGVCVLYAAMPTAPTSYILARQLGGDTDLMSLIITLETLLSPLTILCFHALVTQGGGF